jgi:hypothetical protein
MILLSEMPPRSTSEIANPFPVGKRGRRLAQNFHVCGGFRKIRYVPMALFSGTAWTAAPPADGEN